MPASRHSKFHNVNQRNRSPGPVTWEIPQRLCRLPLGGIGGAPVVQRHNWLWTGKTPNIRDDGCQWIPWFHNEIRIIKNPWAHIQQYKIYIDLLRSKNPWNVCWLAMKSAEILTGLLSPASGVVLLASLGALHWKLRRCHADLFQALRCSQVVYRDNPSHIETNSNVKSRQSDRNW